jgi:predicted  nucleic acid-binding Zn-ribbon protein
MSEVLVLESDSHSETTQSMQLDNPQEPLYYIPLSKGRDKLTVKQRLALLRQELEDLEQDVESEVDPKPFQLTHSYLTEVNNMAKYAEDLIRGQGLEIEGDLGIENNITRTIGKALVGVLPESENSTYVLTTSLPEEVCDVGDRQTATIASISARVTKLEETLGLWSSEYGYFNIQQAFGQIKKRMANLNPKKLEAINKQAEDLNAEMDMIKDQLGTLQSSCVEQKAIDTMYPLVDVVDEIAPILPEIIERLEVIKRVHDEGSRFTERVKEVQERQKRIEEKLAEFKFDDLSQQWESFKKSVEGEFNKLEQKFK